MRSRPSFSRCWEPVCDLLDGRARTNNSRSEEHTSDLQSRSDLVCRLLLEKKKTGCHDNHRSHPDQCTALYNSLLTLRNAYLVETIISRSTRVIAPAAYHFVHLPSLSAFHY